MLPGNCTSSRRTPCSRSCEARELGSVVGAAHPVVRRPIPSVWRSRRYIVAVKILATGSAGFIAFHPPKRLLERGDEVVGLDVVNSYYDPALKEARLKGLEETAASTGSSYHFVRANLAHVREVNDCFAQHKFDRVIHLAAQAGVRYSLVN